MKFDINDPWFTRLIAFVLALILFFFVAYENRSTIQSSNFGNANYSSTEVIPNVPVGININEDEYFVSGVPESVTVRLDGPQAILTQTVVTQNFDVTTPDLSSLGEGMHEINLQLEGISDQLEYTVSPSTTTVTVEEKETATREIDTIQFSEEDYLAEGYTADNINLSQPTVEISGAASTMEEIAEVSAVIRPSSSNISSDFSIEGDIIVLNENGEPLNVNVEPSQVTAEVEVSGERAELPIALEQTGTPEDGYSYQLNLAEGQEDTIEVFGDSATIQDMNEYPVSVDVSGITQSTTRSIPVLRRDGITQTGTNSIEVDIEVTQENSEN